jgi:PiT family inorganic phosphate transporter
MTLTAVLVVVLFLVLAAEFINGWTDAPNAIATVVSTGVLPTRVAILFAVVLNTAGAMAGTAVAATVGKGIVESSALTLPTLGAAMVSIILWGSIAARFGLPVSKSHALLAGLAGAAFAGGGMDALIASGWSKVFLGIGCSFILGFSGAYLIAKAIIYCARNASPASAKNLFDKLQVLSASFMAFNHGLNDGQKFMGVFALALVVGGVHEEFIIPFWVIVVCGLTMGLGTSLGGWRIIKTIGMKLTKLTSWQGFAAETAASLTILGASTFGIPLSTTHTITTSIVGVGASLRLKNVRVDVLGRVISAWAVTFPFCALVAYGAASVALIFF